MTTTVDVAIVGGGVMGSAIACFLAADPAFDGRVIVIERDPGYRRASSALSASSIRQQFSTVENIRMSQYGFAYLEAIDEHLAVTDGDRPSQAIGLHRGGYLYLASPDRVGDLRANHAVQAAAGADVILLGPADLEARFPWLSLDGVALGSLGLHGEGWFDGYGLLMAFRRKARSLDVEYVAAEVVGFDVATGRVNGVRLADGTTIGSGTVVDAAGPWAAEVAAMAGVDLPVAARRRTRLRVHFADDPDRLPARHRHDRRLVPARGRRLHRRDRATTGRRPRRPAAHGRPAPVRRAAVAGAGGPRPGVRCDPDDECLGRLLRGQHLRPQRHPRVASGNHEPPARCGVQRPRHPARAGRRARASPSCVVHGRYVSLDLSVFGYERIAAGRRVVERNIIG